MGFKKIIVSALTAATVISGSAFSIDTAYAQSVSTKTTFSGDYMNFYAPAGKAVVAYDDINKNGEIKYLDLDNMQRATGAYGYISKEMRNEAKERGRQDIKVDPVGWGHNKQSPVEYGDKSYKGWFYNRSHLIADSLGAAPDKTNLVTGTRMQNVGWGNGGMAYIEEKTRKFLDSEKGDNCPVYYAATPNYIGSELLPRTVTVNAKSCDSTIDEQIVVDNVAPGYIINYMNGEFTKGDIPKDQLDGNTNEKDNNQGNQSEENTPTTSPNEKQENEKGINNSDTSNNQNQNNVGDPDENSQNNNSRNDNNSNHITPRYPTEGENNTPNQSQTQIGGGKQSQSENGKNTTGDKKKESQQESKDKINPSSPEQHRKIGGNENSSVQSSPEFSSNTSVSTENDNVINNTSKESYDKENTAYGPKVDTGGRVSHSFISKIISFFKQ